MRIPLFLPLLVSIAAAAPDPTLSARGVLQRLIGQRAAAFELRSIPPAEGGLDVFEVQARGGTVTVRGNSPVSIARGAYTYLREACHCFQGWEGAHLELPAAFPDRPLERVICPYALRPYYNVCTFGYTTAFWGWDRWQREIDWMALHGINLALSHVGTEAIWQRVWLAEGVSQKDLDHYFPGPAFMPWHRMGNINAWQGPPPKGYFPRQIALEKQIVGRMRELGIAPIAPAFAGFVPSGLRTAHPEVKLQALASWADFDREFGTFLLDPVSPLFPEIGRRFIREWEAEFGRNRYFLADSFNELKVPVPADRPGRLAQLARYGQAVHQSLLAGDPDAVWIMQGWLFYNDAPFWDKGSVAALLSRVPNDGMVILDLACDFQPIWPVQDAFYGKQWVYSIIHNFGGKSSLGGDLPFFAADGARTLASPKRGNLVGYGMAPEGVENNEVVYELVTDAMWSRRPIELDRWLNDYCLARYGGCPAGMAEAWRLLRRTCYGRDVHYVRPSYQYLPLVEPKRRYKVSDDSPEYLEAVERFLACGSALGDNALYRADAIELTAQYLGSRIDALLAGALAAHQRGEAPARDRLAASALGLMADLDRLLSAHPVDRLDRWVGFARAWGDNPGESDAYEADSKWLVTIWGGHLTEYSSRVWSGLVGDYYRARWEKAFRHLATGEPLDLVPWERKWIETPLRPRTAGPVADPVAECRRLLEKGKALQGAMAGPRG